MARLLKKKNSKAKIPKAKPCARCRRERGTRKGSGRSSPDRRPDLRITTAKSGSLARGGATAPAPMTSGSPQISRDGDFRLS